MDLTDLLILLHAMLSLMLVDLFPIKQHLSNQTLLSDKQQNIQSLRHQLQQPLCLKDIFYPSLIFDSFSRLYKTVTKNIGNSFIGYMTFVNI